MLAANCSISNDKSMKIEKLMSSVAEMYIMNA